MFAIMPIYTTTWLWLVPTGWWSVRRYSEILGKYTCLLQSSFDYLTHLFSIFTEVVPDSVKISMEYLALCNEYPGIAPLKGVQTHIRHFIRFQLWELYQHLSLLVPHNHSVISSGRRPWFNKFAVALSATKSVQDIEHLVHTKIERWRGHSSRCSKTDDADTDIGTRHSSGLSTEITDLSLVEWRLSVKLAQDSLSANFIFQTGDQFCLAASQNVKSVSVM